MIKVTFLGTNGWYDTETGNTVSVLVETDKEYIILDAGFGFYKAKDLVKEEKPVHLFISHLHLDHIIGLHTLPLFRLEQGLDIYIPKVEDKALKAFLNRPLTTPPILLPTRIRFHNIETSKFPFTFEYAKLQHSVPCYGYRFGLDDVHIAYCTDTGLCNNLKHLALRADIFIAECALPPGDSAPNLFHITPEAAANVAHAALVKQLALFHFDPVKYPTFSEREAAECAAKLIFPNTIAAKDGTVLTV